MSVVIFLGIFLLNINDAQEIANSDNPTIQLTDTYLLPINSPITLINGQIRTDIIRNPDKSEIVDYIKKLWGKNALTMIRIIQCESSFLPTAINWDDKKITGFPSVGISQLNRDFFEGWNDWKINLDEAFKLYQKRGFQPWSCYRKVSKSTE